MGAFLRVENLRTSFFTYAGEVKAVDGVNFELGKGEAMAIVGESGCGKSVTALSIMRLVPEPGKIVGGSILFEGEDLVRKSEREMQAIRGNEISMIFQDPMTSLNPVLTVGLQITEALKRHQGLSGEQARKRAIEMLELVGIPNPERRIKQYPHQFSGGMRQRVMIAMALSCNPKLLIADEPTTALDVTIQAQIIELMRELKDKLGTSILIITHDLGVVAGLASKVIVMYAGKVAEAGSVRDIFHNPQHPYTWGLLKSIPRLDAREKKRLVPIDGQPPDLLAPPKGCSFNPRCEYAMRICLERKPELTECGAGHKAACWLLHPMAARVRRDERRGVS
ncbi:ABC transporter ATP-binding protein [Calderihabitans maritimus]|uniref:Peptide ABC transporter ATP-binding protein n=1 Tax=Calderihabitans maritimus TaxID=1246530 RepID=A0A1Z5HTL4_9FIRM|nr:ABC transporter ATP-binding protein [Calderihabitans maritimus]GAW92864.1 peptide ABC transporter ATP-binding protein [Calderihabitans maritimus]